MLQFPPFFVVGIPRSGTTLLSMLLNAHSMLAVAPETHYFDRHWRRCRRSACLAGHASYRRYVRRFLTEYGAAAFDADASPIRDIEAQILAKEHRSHRSVLGTTLDAYARRQGKRGWGEKTPGHVDYLGEILSEFPEARVIHILRDPRDVLLSLKGVPWGRRGRLFYLRWWKRCATLAERYAERPATFREVRYEDLLSRPDATLDDLCGFLGVTPEAEMLTYDATRSPLFDVRAEPWKAKNLQALDPGNCGKWKSAMSTEEAAMVGSILGDHLEAKGYEPGPRSHWKAVAMLAYATMESTARSSLHWGRRLLNRLAGVREP